MRNTILVVDDQYMNREILVDMFKDEFDIEVATNGQEAIELLEFRKEEILIVLLDIFMPEVDGFGVLEYMNKNEYIKKIPVILITTDSSVELKHKGYAMGVSDFIDKPFEPFLVKKRVKNILELSFHKNQMEVILEEHIGQIKIQNKKLSEMNYRIIDILGTIVEFRTLESSHHILRIRKLSRILLEYLQKFFPEYGLNDSNVEIIAYASAMHDIGKIAIPDTILLKAGKLTDVEFDIMKSHTLRGAEIIEHITALDDQVYMNHCYDIAKSHHERFDGRGYPEGLKGDDIPISAQIVSITDVYDALISERIYKSAYSKEEAFRMIISGECGIFNPKLIQCFKLAKEELESV